MKWNEIQLTVNGIALAIGLASSILTVSAQAPSPEERKQLIAQSVAEAKRAVESIRPVLFKDLTPRERTVYENIDFQITSEDSGWLAGGTVSQYGDRVVSIDEGYIRSIEMISDALLLEQRLGKEFVPQYVHYVAAELQRKATFIPAPYAFAGISMAEVDALDRDKAFTQQRNAISVNSMAFILAHEVGHQVLGHYDHPLPPSDIEGAQRREMEADHWAIQQMAKAHLSPLGGLPPILFDYYMSPFMSPDKSHPAPIQRVRELFRSMEDALPEFRADVEAQGQSYEAFRAGIERQLADLESRIASTPDLNWKNNGSDPFCTAVSSLVEIAKSRFRSISATPSGDGESFDASILVPGAQRCTVWHYHDRSMGDSVVCVFARTSTRDELVHPFEQTSSALAGCLEAWSSRTFQGVEEKQTTFANVDGNVRVWLRLSHSRRNGTYMLSLWFDRD